MYDDLPLGSHPIALLRKTGHKARLVGYLSLGCSDQVEDYALDTTASESL